MIDAPQLLNEKTWCIQLPRRNALRHGLTIKILRPGQVPCTTLRYHPPTALTCGMVVIGMPTPQPDEKVGIISCEAATSKRPILTELDLGSPQSELMLMARTLAFEGAYGRLAAYEPPAH